MCLSSDGAVLCTAVENTLFFWSSKDGSLIYKTGVAGTVTVVSTPTTGTVVKLLWSGKSLHLITSSRHAGEFHHFYHRFSCELDTTSGGLSFAPTTEPILLGRAPAMWVRIHMVH